MMESLFLGVLSTRHAFHARTLDCSKRLHSEKIQSTTLVHESNVRKQICYHLVLYVVASDASSKIEKVKRQRQC
jgi:hypothetical protein